jgi:hypothetical protein
LCYQFDGAELRQVGGLSPAFVSLVEASLALLGASLGAFDALGADFLSLFLFFFFSAILFYVYLLTDTTN